MHPSYRMHMLLIKIREFGIRKLLKKLVISAYVTKVCLKSPIPLLSIRGMGLYKVLNEDLSSFRTNPLM